MVLCKCGGEFRNVTVCVYSPPFYRCNKCNEVPPRLSPEKLAEIAAKLGAELKALPPFLADDAFTKFTFPNIKAPWPSMPKFDPEAKPAWEGLFDGITVIVEPGCESSPIFPLLKQIETKPKDDKP